MKRPAKRKSPPARQTLELDSGEALDIPALPAKYANLATAGGRDFNPVPHDNLRLFFAGPVGEGKTTFACSDPMAAILDFENKTSAVGRFAPGTHAFYLRTIPEYEDFFRDLISDAHHGRQVFKRIWFDVIDSFAAAVRAHLTGEKGYFTFKDDRGRISVADAARRGMEGAGWDDINKFVTGWIGALYAAGYSWGVLCHIREKILTRTDGTSTVHSETDVTPRIRDYLHNNSEYGGVIERVDDVDIQVIGGRKRGVNVSKYALVLDASQAVTPTRQHIPLVEEVIELPLFGGYVAFAQAYDVAVEERRQLLLKNESDESASEAAAKPRLRKRLRAATPKQKKE